MYVYGWSKYQNKNASPWGNCRQSKHIPLPCDCCYTNVGFLTFSSHLQYICNSHSQDSVRFSCLILFCATSALEQRPPHTVWFSSAQWLLLEQDASWAIPGCGRICSEESSVTVETAHYAMPYDLCACIPDILSVFLFPTAQKIIVNTW